VAVSYLQSRATYNTGDSFGLAFSNNVAAGSLVVVAITQWREGGVGADSAVSDSQGNQYNKVDTRMDTVDGMALELWYAFTSSGGALTVTVNPQSTSTSLAIHEFGGITSTNPIDVQDQNTGADNSCFGGPVTTANASDLLVAAMTSGALNYSAGVGAGEVITPDADYTQMQEYEDGDSYSVLNTQYRIVGGTLTDTANWTLGQSWNWAGWVVAFKAGAAATTPIPVFMHHLREQGIS
jgi:hypothetical protein